MVGARDGELQKCFWADSDRVGSGRVGWGGRGTDHDTHLVVCTSGNPVFHRGDFLLFDAPPRPGDAARWSAPFAAEFPEAGRLVFRVDGTDGSSEEAASRWSV